MQSKPLLSENTDDNTPKTRWRPCPNPQARTTPKLVNKRRPCCAKVAEGEKAYREKRYQTAQNIYLESKDDIGRLLAETPEIVAGLLDAGQLALANGISAEAAEAFQQVLKIEADNEAAQ
ncbi:MAG: hypothetical protein ACPHUF_04620, partial [Gammaproteobacteria bacterium]